MYSLCGNIVFRMDFWGYALGIVARLSPRGFLSGLPIYAFFAIGSLDLTYIKNSVTHRSNSEPPVKSRKVVILSLREEEADDPC
jgi:hypothetical protein